jgi:tetratricopeptide (TPR) repeat protein
VIRARIVSMEHLRPAALILLSVMIVAAAGGAGTASPQAPPPEGSALPKSDPSSPEERRDPAQTWAMRSHAALGEGNLALARDYAEKALQSAPGEAGLHLLLGTILFRQNDLYYAHRVLERGLELDPGNTGAHTLLGDIYYREGLLDLALDQWRTVPSDSPHARGLGRKIEKVKREMKLEEDYGREVSRNFTILFDGPVPRAVVRALLTQLERAYRLLDRELGSTPSGDILVILYSRVDFHRITSWPKWAGGIYDGKIRIPVKGLSAGHGAASLDPILRHELTHAFLQSMVGRRLPLWFEEGLAEYFERKTWEKEGTDSPRRRHRSFSSLQEINRGLRGKEDSVAAAYDAAAEAVYALIREQGFPAIPALLEKVSAGASFPAALEEETGLSLEELYGL